MNFTNLNKANYNAWLHWNVTGKCNFDCEYCFGHSAVGSQKINRIDIDKLISTLENMGKTFRISFTGGEPFLIPNFLEACESITQNHFISINSHLASNKVGEFVEKIHAERILFIQASLHMKELDKKNLTHTYIDNFHLCKKKGIQIFAEAVAYPNLAFELEKYREKFVKEEIEFTFGAYYGDYKGKKYPESYTLDEIELFKLDKSELTKFSQKGNLCNAGINAGVVYSNGDVYPCFQIKESIGNIYEEINFEEKLINCPARYCGCPLNVYDEYLFNLLKK